eukprot:8703470-Pyramimonas_sp.AAC.1
MGCPTARVAPRHLRSRHYPSSRPPFLIRLHILILAFPPSLHPSLPPPHPPPPPHHHPPPHPPPPPHPHSPPPPPPLRILLLIPSLASSFTSWVYSIPPRSRCQGQISFEPPQSVMSSYAIHGGPIWSAFTKYFVAS